LSKTRFVLFLTFRDTEWGSPSKLPVYRNINQAPLTVLACSCFIIPRTFYKLERGDRKQNILIYSNKRQYQYEKICSA